MNRKKYYSPQTGVHLKPFRPDLFLEQLEYYKTRRSSVKVKDFRQIITNQTYQAIKVKEYLLPNGRPVHLNQDDLVQEVRSTDLYTEKLLKNKTSFPGKQLIVEVTQKDYLKVAEEMSLKEKLNPIVVIGVHPVDPGGTFLTDGKIYSDGIEEDAYRRTTLFNALKDPHQFKNEEEEEDVRNWEYKIPEFGGIVSADSKILRGPEEDGYPFLEKPVDMAFLLQTPMKKVKVEKVKKKDHPQYEFFFDEMMLTDPHRDKMMKKLIIMLEIALISNHYTNDSIVITPGFLSFFSPPFHVGIIMKSVIEKKFKNKFKKIVFATRENAEAKWAVYGQFNPIRYAIQPCKENLVTDVVHDKNPEKWGSYDNKGWHGGSWKKGGWKGGWKKGGWGEKNWKGGYDRRRGGGGGGRHHSHNERLGGKYPQKGWKNEDDRTDLDELNRDGSNRNNYNQRSGYQRDGGYKESWNGRGNRNNNIRWRNDDRRDINDFQSKSQRNYDADFRQNEENSRGRGKSEIRSSSNSRRSDRSMKSDFSSSSRRSDRSRSERSDKSDRSRRDERSDHERRRGNKVNHEEIKNLERQKVEMIKRIDERVRRRGERMKRLEQNYELNEKISRKIKELSDFKDVSFRVSRDLLELSDDILKRN